MKKLCLLFIFAVFLISGFLYASGKVDWDYSGNKGPEHWGKLDESYALCAQGKNQSPVNLKGFLEANLEAIKLNYSTFATEILNNGHTIQVNYKKGSKITIDNRSFELKQFHFHSPSEHQIGNKSFLMEAHFVHADEKGNLAVIGVMFMEGEKNPFIESLWNKMPKKAGDKHTLDTKMNAMKLMPEKKAYYRYNGSLTTPPCSEGVRWIVMKQPLTVSKDQVKTFVDVMHHTNNRPVQPINARPILQ